MSPPHLKMHNLLQKSHQKHPKIAKKVQIQREWERKREKPQKPTYGQKVGFCSYKNKEACEKERSSQGWTSLHTYYTTFLFHKSIRRIRDFVNK